MQRELSAEGVSKLRARGPRRAMRPAERGAGSNPRIDWRFLRRAAFLAAIPAILLAGCSSSSTGTKTPPPPTSTGPVSLTMTDSPPAGVSVLFFSVNLVSASLTPTSGSAVTLMSSGTPIRIDVTELQALSTFLTSVDVPVGTYSGMSLEFADPQIVIYNTSDQSIAWACPLASVCELSPGTGSTSTVTVSGAPFPLTVATNSPLGLQVDFHQNTILQSGFTVNLAAQDAVTVSELAATGGGSASFGSVTGTVQSVNASQNEFTMLAGWGASFTIAVNSSTPFNDFPNTTCAAGKVSCLVEGEIVQAEVGSLESAGTPLATQIKYLQSVGEQTVEGTIVRVTASTTTPGAYDVELIVHSNPTGSASYPLGAMASVTVTPTASYSLDANGFSLPTGYQFANGLSLCAGQDVQLAVVPGSFQAGSSAGGTSNWGPDATLSFSASSIALEPSQITGMVAQIGTGSLVLGTYPSYFYGPFAAGQANNTTVMTSAGTTYSGFSSSSFQGLARNDVISVNGWLFPQNGALDPAIGPPIVIAQSMTLHEDGVY
jgi:hypothetical protein